MTDGRVFAGSFMAYDSHMNIVIGDCEEFRKVKEQGIEREEKRSLGLMILRGDAVVSLTVEGPPPKEDSRGAAAKSTMMAGAGIAKTAARGMAIPGMGMPGMPGMPGMGMGTHLPPHQQPHPMMMMMQPGAMQQQQQSSVQPGLAGPIPNMGAANVGPMMPGRGFAPPPGMPFPPPPGMPGGRGMPFPPPPPGMHFPPPPGMPPFGRGMPFPPPPGGRGFPPGMPFPPPGMPFPPPPQQQQQQQPLPPQLHQQQQQTQQQQQQPPDRKSVV